MIAVDTNLLVYAHRSGLPEHRQAQRAVEKACGNPKGWAIPVFCAAEFWAVVTHPSSSPRPSQAKEARAFLAELCAAGAKVLYPRDGFLERLARLASDLKIRGPWIFRLPWSPSKGAPARFGRMTATSRVCPVSPPETRCSRAELRHRKLVVHAALLPPCDV